MITPSLLITPSNIVNSLTRMHMQPFTDEDLDKLPPVIIASDDIKDPKVLDRLIDIEMIYTILPWIL